MRYAGGTVHAAAGEDPRDGRLPVVVLTGFLGAGKTTLLNALLREPRMQGTAVVINEYGPVGLDQQLVAASGPEDIELIDGGCICCTVRGRLAQALVELLRRARAKELPTLRRLVIETTGLAEPGPIIGELLQSRRLAPLLALDSTIALVDAVNGAATIERHAVAQRQVTAADCIFLTKTDLAGEAAAAALAGRLRQLNPDARLDVVEHGRVAPERVFCGAARIAADGAYEPGAWLAAADAIRFVPEAPEAPASLDDIQTFSLILDEPLDRDRLLGWLEYLRATAGPDLLRVKGLVHLRGYGGPIVLHGVQNVFHPPQALPDWPDADRRTRMVFITRGYSAASIRRLLARLQGAI